MTPEERTKGEAAVATLQEECKTLASEQTDLHSQAEAIQNHSRKLGAARNAKISQRRAIEKRLRDEENDLPTVTSADIPGASASAEGGGLTPAGGN